MRSLAGKAKDPGQPEHAHPSSEIGAVRLALQFAPGNGDVNRRLVLLLLDDGDVAGALEISRLGLGSGALSGADMQRLFAEAVSTPSHLLFAASLVEIAAPELRPEELSTMRSLLRSRLESLSPESAGREANGY